MKKVILKKNRYVDSVSLMAVGDKVTKLEGVSNAEAQMCTPANLEVLDDLGYTLPEDVTANDLALAVTAETEEQIEAAMQMIMDIIDHKTNDGGVSYKSLSEIDLREDGYDLVQISLPGEYAAAEAKKALSMGLDVFIFSDNVSLEEEADIKKYGNERGRLVMGPDCGVGLIEGVALGAGSGRHRRCIRLGRAGGFLHRRASGSRRHLDHRHGRTRPAPRDRRYHDARRYAPPG